MTSRNNLNCILLVDDDPDDNFLHELIIKENSTDAQVVITENGEHAWQYLSNPERPDFRKPSVIFLDINMPRMNGFEFLELYKTLPESTRAATKVVVLTTSSHPQDMEKVNAIYSAADYRTKPLTSEILLEVLGTSYTSV
jgi:CheY-like chemotaxis protein